MGSPANGMFADELASMRTTVPADVCRYSDYNAAG